MAGLLGLNVRIVLRETTKLGSALVGDDVVGECYIECIMCGQMIRAQDGPDGYLVDINYVDIFPPPPDTRIAS